MIAHGFLSDQRTTHAQIGPVRRTSTGVCRSTWNIFDLAKRDHVSRDGSGDPMGLEKGRTQIQYLEVMEFSVFEFHEWAKHSQVALRLCCSDR